MASKSDGTEIGGLEDAQSGSRAWLRFPYGRITTALAELPGEVRAGKAVSGAGRSLGEAYSRRRDPWLAAQSANAPAFRAWCR